VANIDAPTLIALAPALAAVVAPGGTLAVTGLLAERSEEVARALAASGLAPDRQQSEEDWCLIELARP
jgi:ribosomal protein L11 methyltransferase